MSLMIVLGLQKFVPPTGKKRPAKKRIKKPIVPKDTSQSNERYSANTLAAANYASAQKSIDIYRKAFKAIGGQGTSADIAKKIKINVNSVSRFARRHPELIGKTGEYIGQMPILYWIEPNP